MKHMDGVSRQSKGRSERGDEAVITHRCEGSQKAGVSIRGWFETGMIGVKPVWWMLRLNPSDVCGEPAMERITKIKYCPFCGQELEEPKGETSDDIQSHAD